MLCCVAEGTEMVRTRDAGVLAAELAGAVEVVRDFPVEGVLFRDIGPVLRNAALFRRATVALAGAFAGARVTQVVGVESRGFVLGAPVAQHLGAGFVPARKAGRLPGRLARAEYELEYGECALEVQHSALGAGDRVLIVDDVLATGGTAAAACRVVESLGAVVVGCGFLLEIDGLEGRRALGGRDLEVLLRV